MKKLQLFPVQIDIPPTIDSVVEKQIKVTIIKQIKSNQKHLVDNERFPKPKAREEFPKAACVDNERFLYGKNEKSLSDKLEVVCALNKDRLIAPMVIEKSLKDGCLKNNTF